MDADAIVIGAGLSRLAACLELARAGRRAVLLDSEPRQALGGQALVVRGLFLVDSPYQRRLGIADSASWHGRIGWGRLHSTRRGHVAAASGPRIRRVLRR